MLSYIPLDNGRFILTQSRDETIMRPTAAPPIKKRLGDVDVVFPVDPKGRGTWIGVSSAGNAAALLNGGGEQHKHQPPYRHSRGLIIPEFLKATDFASFYRSFDFDGLEPFTMITFENRKIFEIVKSEEEVKVTEHDASKPLFRLSYQLFPETSINERSLEFYRWYYKRKVVTAEQVFDYHAFRTYELPHIKKYDTGEHILKTVSITQVISNNRKFQMNYYDAVNDIHLFNFTKIDNPAGVVP